MTRLVSPRGVVVSVREDKAAALLGGGYKPVEEPKPEQPRKPKEAMTDDTPGDRGRRRGKAQARK